MNNRSSSISWFLIRFFWFFTKRFMPSFCRRLMVWGIKDGAFPKKRTFDPILQVNLWGKTFKNPIGVAAGVDINGDLLDSLIPLGFGFGEFGSYTLEGELPPRYVNYFPFEGAIFVQCNGYRNVGLATVLPKLIGRRYLPHIVGINIATTSKCNDDNIKEGQLMSYETEFAEMVRRVAPYCDYVVLNFSHPMLELSRMISDSGLLKAVIQEARSAIFHSAKITPPALLLKLPADMTDLEIKTLATVLIGNTVDGVIIGGAMRDTRNLKSSFSSTAGKYKGQISGKPVKEKNTELIRKFYQCTEGKIPIIACGGVFSGKDAYEKICAGASLIQLHTGVIYKGPTIANSINRDLAGLLKGHGFTSIAQAVGSDFRDKSQYLK